MDNPFEILIQQNTEILNRLKVIETLGLPSLPSITKESKTDPEVRFTITELAQYLNKDRSTILRYKKNGMFKYFQAGKTVFFKRKDVDAAMSSMAKVRK